MYETTQILRPTLFNPDASLLLRSMAPYISNSMLEEISAADYGNDKATHFLALSLLRDELSVPHASWIPCEVLELIRWSRPDQKGWHPGAEGERGHWMRAFSCCGLLLIAGRDGIDRLVSLNEVIGPMLSSLLALNRNLWSELGSFLEWFANTAHSAGRKEEDAFLGTAILFAYCRANVAADIAANELADWTLARELTEWASAKDARWLFRTTTHKLNSDTWTAVLEDMLSQKRPMKLKSKFRESLLNGLDY